MALIDRVQAYRTARLKAASASYPDWALRTAHVERHALTNLDLPDAQARLYQKLGWVNAAVSAVARAVALEPFNVYELAGETRDDVENHPFELLLQKPNPLMSRYELLFATTAWRKLTGNAYWWLNRPNPQAPPAEIWVIPAKRMEPVPDGRLYLRGYLYDPGDGVKVPLEPHEVVHFKGFHPSSEFLGASDVEAFAWTAQGDYAMAEWNARFFDQDNAKFPGVLAFADPIPDTAWDNMKREFNEQHGGAKRHMRMMRNVGPGGVQWIQTSMAQKDMEFLRGREFNRDEIFSILAPGLSSVLAVNATEANAVAGKSTLMEHAVWPEMVSIAEKITNDLLGAYGPNLVGEFDDPRVTDRTLELAERRLWQMVHTVDEVREHYDSDDPIGDERGALLVPQVAKLSDGGEEPTRAARTGGGISPSAPAEDDTPLPEPEPVPQERIATLKARELGTLRRWARKRKQPKAEDFASDVLSIAEIRAALKAEEEEPAERYYLLLLALLARLRAGDLEGTERTQALAGLAALLGTGGATAPRTGAAYARTVEALALAVQEGVLSAAEMGEQLHAVARETIIDTYVRELGVRRDELTGEDWAAIDEQIRISQGAAVGLATDLAGGRYTDKPAALSARLGLWGNSLAAVTAIAMLHKPNDPLLEWVYDPSKEHCGDCLNYDGQVHRASEWEAMGARPQSRDLECGGWNCGCDFVEVRE